MRGGLTRQKPDHFDIKDSDFDVKTYLGSFRSVHNAFPLVTNRGVYEHQRQATSDKRVFLLTRSSFLGGSSITPRIHGAATSLPPGTTCGGRLRPG